MPRLTVTISDEHERILERQSDVGEAYRSKSEVIRECIEAHERVEELSEQLACLEAEVELLRDQRAKLKEKAARVDELESQLRQLQAAYHRAISEGRSPQELEPMAELSVDSGPSAQALIEEAESPSETPTIEESDAAADAEPVAATTTATREAADSPDPETADPPAQTAVGQSGAETATSEGSPQSVEETPDRSDGEGAIGWGESPAAHRGESPSPAATQSESSRSAQPATTDTGATAGSRSTDAEAESATDGGVEIDEELLYQSPSVGSRLKSALFGGPGGSR
ncbi:hypothetical protein GRX03_00975 [Halovenus sp. WSH3]|uniref:Ribbon-helix-helix protein CopG domain-containing protein n=1 Tax=Halovenus carboxidivorans TaxID=2692199 RepID=A0A6B0T3X9_9EURY|nr:hypothetical protein [Halovenus carboxidivorans]MXR50183.1 hypothetical protein [Halovenus carboxidivorans]